MHECHLISFGCQCGVEEAKSGGMNVKKIEEKYLKCKHSAKFFEYELAKKKCKYYGETLEKMVLSFLARRVKYEQKNRS